MTEILFVHGALVRDGDWWWRPVAELVERASGVHSRAIALPSCGEGAAAAGSSGLSDDARALRRALDDVDGGALVVGHSYGGTVIAEGADHPAAQQLLYISSYLPDVGMSQGGIMSDEQNPVAIAPNEDGTLGVSGYDEDSFAARFLHDVSDPSVRAAGWARVTTQGAGAFLTPTTEAAWQGRPSTYLVCTEDRSTSVQLQRLHAARATRSVDLPTGHHPFISRPELVADQVNAILDAMT
jgi:pimeloyl-ACP methyl ester carboxylesterase